MSKLDKTILFLCGVIALSPLSSYLSITLLHFPLNPVELFLLPFIYVLIKQFHIRFYFAHLAIFLFFLIELCLLGLLNPEYTTKGVLSTARTYLLMGVCFLAAFNNPDFDLEKVEWLAWGSVAAWVFFSINFYFEFIPDLTIAESGITYGNTLAGCFLIFSTAFRRKKVGFSLIVIAVILLSLFAGLRRAIIVFVFSGLLIALFFVFRFKIMELLVTLCIASAAFFTFMNSEDYIKENYPELHFRVYVKTFRLAGEEVGLEDDSDEKRKEFYISLLDDPKKRLVPRGFVSKQTLEDDTTGIFIDCPTHEFVYTLGWPLFLLLLFFYCSNVLHLLMDYIRTKEVEKAILFCVGCSFLFLLLLDGMVLSFIYIVPLTGCLMGMIYSDKKIKQNEEEEMPALQSGASVHE